MTAHEVEHIPATAAREGRAPGDLPVERALRACARTGKAHIETWRPYTLAYPGLVGLAGAALNSTEGTAADGYPDAGRLLVAWAAPTLGWVSGHYIGDWFDRALDAISKPQRPLPSGRLGPRAALTCGIGCAAAAAVAAATVNWRTVVLFAVAMLGIVAYSRLLKGRGLTGNAVRGALTATTVIFGAMTVAELPSWQVLLFAGVFCAQDTASNLVGTLRDVEGDRRGGCRTVPVRHGVRAAVRTATALHTAALVTAVPALLLVKGGPGSGALALLLCAAACGVAAFVPLLRHGMGERTSEGRDVGERTGADVRRDGGETVGEGAAGGEPGAPAAAPAVLDPRRALRAHEVLVAERMLLAGALLAVGWGPVPALAVVVPLLAVSLVAQSRMRSRHEFPDPDPDADAAKAADPGARAGGAPGTSPDGAPQAPHAAATEHQSLRGDVTSC
ncbi:UbiA family prenyltransferase [Streptomyces sp. HNM0575]|uniref:UbiA family prenyltransferase n=1 Tax=Streptomyces sp. HNM0575 TaxID=2716338 RepID=UPI00145DE4A2|nr:UbiA family prenyltransferase [Streptomyces sp. HNM0575]NLU75755.1 UbiA family prenyltransferase [Streptomyces sp. HNM0575]